MQTSQLDQLLKFLTDTLQQGKDFTIEQAPKFVQELLWWKYYEALFWCGVGVLFMVFGIVLGQFMVGFYTKELGGDADERRCARWLPSLGGFVLGCAFIATNVYTMVEIKVAPRVVLVEMVRSLIAGNH